MTVLLIVKVGSGEVVVVVILNSVVVEKKPMLSKRD